MDQKVLIYDDLKKSLALSVSFLELHDVEVIQFRAWNDIARHIHDPQCTAIVLAVSMEEMNGIDCCRQIKQRAAFQPLSVIIVSAGDVGKTREEALKAGCDHFASGDEAGETVLEALEGVLLPDTRPAPRVASRFQLSGRMFCLHGNQALLSEILNASRTGILFAATEVIPKNTNITIRLQSVEGNEFDLSAIVKRIISLPLHYGEFRHGIGAQFLEMGSEHAQALDWILAYRERRIPNWSYDAVVKILKANVHRLAGMLLDETSRAFLDAFSGDLRPFEQDALTSDSTLGALVRSLLAFRIQCVAFSTFMPELQRDQRTLGKTFLPLLEELFFGIKEVEIQAEKKIQDCLAESELADHQNLISAADTLHAAKLKLLFAADENLTLDGLDTKQRALLRSIRGQVSVVRKQQRSQEIPRSD